MKVALSVLSQARFTYWVDPMDRRWVASGASAIVNKGVREFVTPGGNVAG